MSLAMSYSVLSLPEDAPPLAPPWVSSSESNSSFVCWRSFEMSTFSCIPNTSGCWLNGSPWNTTQELLLSWMSLYRKINKQIHMYPLYVCYLKWLYLDKFNVVLIDRFRWGIVFSARWERVARFLNDVLVVEVSQDGHQEPPIPVVCHTATIVTLPGQVSYGLEGHLIIFIHKQLKRKTNECILDSWNVETWPLKLWINTCSCLMLIRRSDSLKP